MKDNLINDLKDNKPNVEDVRSYILVNIVRLARVAVPESIDENGKLKPAFEFFVVYSILCYQDFEQEFLKDFLIKDNG